MRALLPVRLSLIAAVLAALFVCNTAMAQVSGMAIPTPTVGSTSPLGIAATGSPVSPTGIPLGSTEIVSPGVSPAPGDATGTISMPGSSTLCSTIGTAPSSMFGSTASFDGGGMSMGTGAPATAATSAMSTSSGMPASSGLSTSSAIAATSATSTTSGTLETSGMSGMCGSGSSSITASSTPTSTSPTTPGGVARTGIPLGSIEIGNLGVSSAAAVPTLGVSPIVGSVGSTAVVPTIPTVTPPAAAAPAMTSAFACPNTGLPPGASGGC